MSAVYHVTTSTGRMCITTDKAIDPEFSRGKDKRCWFVPRDKVAWAILHVARRHGVQLADVFVVEVPVGTRQFFSHAGTGLLYRKCLTRLTGSEDWTGWDAWCLYDDPESQELARKEASMMFDR